MTIEQLYGMTGSMGIAVEAASMGVTPRRMGDNGMHGDTRLVLWSLGGSLVFDTNGDPVWEDEEGFGDLMAEISDTVRAGLEESR